jgi:hypothetical protein
MTYVLKVCGLQPFAVYVACDVFFHAVSDKANQIISDFFKFPALRALMKQQVTSLPSLH